MAIFPTLFLGNIGQENIFYDILKRQNAFLGYKNTSSKSRKIDIFPKGLTHGFFNFLFLGNVSQENVFYDILKRKNAFLGYKNKKFKKPKNWHFPKRVNPWFWSKNGNFSYFFCLGNMGQENIFYDILDGENAFRGYKNKKFKVPVNWHFPKGVNAWFWSINGDFSNLIFRQYRPGKYLLWYSRTIKRLSRL